MENVINHDFKNSLSSDFLKFQQPHIVHRQQYNESNLTELGACSIKRKDSGYSWRNFSFSIQKLRCLICLSKSLSPRETATELRISYQTLEAHLSALRWRLGFPSKKSMIAELRVADFGKIISSLPTDPYSLWKLIEEKVPKNT